MPQPDIDFRQIRAHRGSREHGFEELCCQIASLEPRPATALYHRKGLGADAGVECFVADKDMEAGWQAKYFFEFGTSQVSQLDESIKQALAKHPALNRYVVCLPFNLRDSRVGKAQTELERWDAWVAKWLATASKTGRQLKIELWDSTALLERLTRTDPLYVGRARYWFDQTLFDSTWFEARLAESIRGLGDRYTPETNVDLPIRRTLLALGRDQSVEDEAATLLQALEEVRYRTTNSLGRLLKRAADRKLVTELDESVGALSKSMSKSSFDPGTKLVIEEWSKLAKVAVSVTYKCQGMMWNRKASKDEDLSSTQYAHHELQQLSDALHNILEAISEDRWQAVNIQQLLVHGEAGVGKSHLFGDAAMHCVERQKPALLVLGGNFVDGEPWTQILQQFGLQTLDVRTFLGALDAAAQTANTRALILIDAINERKGLEVWPTRLATFLQTVAQFPRVAIAVSCRSTYLEYIVDASLTTKQLLRIEHVGFAGRAGEAARVYLDRRGIVRMAAPNLIPEFENPLFLKTCCDFLQKEGLSEFPRGLRGVTQIFDFYFSAVAKQIEKRLHLDHRQKIVARATSAIAEAGDGNRRGYVEYKTASDLLEAILPSNGSLERNLLAQLESEGMLTVEPSRQSDGTLEQFVRFTFERYSDHRTASHLLDQNLDLSNPMASFAAGTVLNEFLAGNQAYWHRGAIEALAVQLPERTELELPDALPANPLAWQAFKKSILWRKQTCFRDRTLELLGQMPSSGRTDHVLSTLIAIASEPENHYNALYLHKKLMAMTMPQRDSYWSTFIARSGDNKDSPVQTLIGWTRLNGVSHIADERAELVAITLSWLFSTSHREIRDTATKALATLLAKRLDLAAKLVRRFAPVNDSYVFDRVLASAYGAALQGLTTNGLGTLAAAVYDAVFAVEDMTPHVLIRDHAHGIIEFAKVTGVLPKRVPISRARPPYRSSWPLKDVSKRKVESYKQTYPKGGVFTDQIVSSTVNDGDFARYIVDSAVRHWSNLPIDAAGKSGEALYREWDSKVTHRRPIVRKALKDIIGVCIEFQAADKSYSSPKFDVLFSGLTRERGPRAFTKDKKAEEARTKKVKALNRKFAAAEKKLKTALSAEDWDGYCNYARPYLHEGIYSAKFRYPWPPHYDSSKIRRWVCKRAHDLGWKPDLFASAEQEIHYGGRMDHRVERIGKKYQWIALHEALGCLADNLAFISGSNEKLGRFEGPWQLSIRDIDPSSFHDRTFADGWKQWAATWWMPFDISLKRTSPQARLLWLDGQNDIANSPELLLVTDPKTNTEWFVLDEYVGWHQWGVGRGETTYDRVSDVAVNSLLVGVSDRDRLLEALKGRMFGSHDLPSLNMEGYGYLGEYCWHPLYNSEKGWVFPTSWNKIPVAVMPTEFTYSAEKSGYDCSIEESFSVKLPSPGLMHGLKMHLSGAQNMSYENDSGKLVFFDPSVQAPGPSAALVEKNAFLEFLRREKLAVIWIVTARKEVFGGKRHGNGWGGDRIYCSLYWLTKDGFRRMDHEECKDPSAKQLEEFLSDSPEEAIPAFFRRPKAKKELASGISEARKTPSVGSRKHQSAKRIR